MDSSGDLLVALIPPQLADKVRASRGSIEGERKRVTVLFADVQGSTGLAERLDPEEVVEIMNGLFSEMVMAVHTYEGMVDKFLGDGILALFGAPVIHEDDPRRAVMAALELVERCRRHSDRFEAERGGRLPVRVGLNTGTVVVGAVGSDLRMEYTAMGDTVNVAQRVQAAAPGDGVLITDATRRLVAPYFDLQPFGSFELKGRTEPVGLHLVVADRHLTRTVRGIEGLRSPMLGRDQELTALLEAVHRLAEGKGGAIAVLGDAGLGKSRLLSELKHAVPSIRWAQGHALSFGAATPYLPIRELLLDLVGQVATPAESDLSARLRDRVAHLHGRDYEEALADLGSILGLTAPTPPEHRPALLDPELLRRRTVATVVRLFQAEALQNPLVLVVEDLHWADDATLEVVAALVDAGRRSPLLLLTTARPESGGLALAHPDFHQVLHLRPLDPWESERLVGNYLEVVSLPEPLRELILRKAEGNPLFVEELIRVLIDARAVERRGADWILGEGVDHVDLPDTLEGVIGARIDRLPADAKALLQTASVIGRTFTDDVLTAVTAAEVDDPQPVLAELELRALVTPADRSGERAFHHALTQEAAYASLLKTRRRELHRRVGETLEARDPAGLEQLAVVLGRHFEEAGVATKAAHHLNVAGRRAARDYANREAIQLFTRALALNVDHVFSFEVLRSRAQVLGLVDRYEEQRADAEAMLQIAEDSGDAGRRIEALRVLVAHYLVTDPRRAWPLLGEGLELADRIGDQVGRARLLCQQAEVEMIQYSLPRAAEALEAAIPVFDAAGLEKEAAEARVELVRTLQGAAPDRLRKAVADALESARRVGELRLEAIAHRQAALAWLALGDYEGALADSQKAIEVARRTGDRLTESRALLLLGVACRSLGRASAAQQCFLDVIGVADAAGMEVGWRYGAMQLVEAWEAEGKFEELLAWLRSVLPTLEARGDRHNLSYVTYAIGYRGLRWLGAYEEALDHVNRAADLTEQDEWQPPRVMYRNAQAGLLIELGRFAEASVTLDEAFRVTAEYQMEDAVLPYLLITQIRLALAGPPDLLEVVAPALQRLHEFEGRPDYLGEGHAAALLHAEFDLRNGRSGEAVEWARRAADLEPQVRRFTRWFSREHTLWALGRALRAEGRDAEAAAILDEARRQVEETSASIADPELRRSYRERVEPVRRILQGEPLGR